MFTNKKNIFITLFIVLLAGVIFALIFSDNMPQASQSEHESIYGTYRLNINNLNNAEYIAVIPPISDEDVGQFQWYNVDNKVLQQGTCKISDDGFVTLCINDKYTSTIFCTNNHYYFINNASEAREITKISQEPIVCQPVDAVTNNSMCTDEQA